MRTTLTIAATALAMVAAGGARAATVQIRDAVARVTVVPEDRADVKVEIVSSNPKLPLEVRTEGGETLIEGNVGHRMMNCRSRSQRPSVWIWGVGDVGANEMPQLVIHTPRNVSLASGGAVFGAIGRAASLELHDSGCSNWTIADVQGPALIRESGAGLVRMGSAGRLEVHLSGAADLHAVRATQGLNAQLSGKGGVKIEDLAGPLEARVSGMGRVQVAGGHASDVRADISGVGGVEFGGSADALAASISGMGTVHVKRVTGPISRSVSGMGHITIDEARS